MQRLCVVRIRPRPLGCIGDGSGGCSWAGSGAARRSTAPARARPPPASPPSLLSADPPIRFPGGRRCYALTPSLASLPPPDGVRCGNRYRRRPFSSSSSKARMAQTNGGVERPVDDEEDDVIHDTIIVGGGPTGLFLSALLSAYGVRSHLLFERRPESDLLAHPQAHFLNVRTMEILRSEAPQAYMEVLGEMPPVREWERFRFGCSVLGREVAAVVNPVSEPLREGQDGRGVLLPQGMVGSSRGAKEEEGDGDDNSSSPFVSPCRAGHLAQNRFVAILLREARRLAAADSDSEVEVKPDVDPGVDENSGRAIVPLPRTRIQYGEEVVSVRRVAAIDGGEPTVAVTVRGTSTRTYRARYVVAADGASSPTRESSGLDMVGERNMQHLVNVHFRTNPALSRRLVGTAGGRRDSRGMLHFVYHPMVVGAFVCHDGRAGEWVAQVPYFPPFQTIEGSFAPGKVREMIRAGLGLDEGVDEEGSGAGGGEEGIKEDDDEEEEDFEILSVQPWTMSAVLARSYLADGTSGGVGSGDSEGAPLDPRIILAGDAAHAFPPAGGFGMNTGLQDAHNLAWRLALLLGGRGDGDSVDGRAARSTLLRYEAERQSVARDNAALSVRNYRRTLQLAASAYLDARHPELLVSALSSTPLSSVLPLSVRGGAFEAAVRAAMAPLGSLRRRGNFHGDRIERRIRSVLEAGGGLPLVFPRYELGFSYRDDDSAMNPNDAERGGGGGGAGNDYDEGSGRSDTAGYVSRIAAGHRMPNIVVETLATNATEVRGEGRGNDGPFLTGDGSGGDDDSRSYMSLVDIAAHSRRCLSLDGRPLFVVLAIGTAARSVARGAMNDVVAGAHDGAPTTAPMAVPVPMCLVELICDISEVVDDGDVGNRRYVQEEGEDEEFAGGFPVQRFVDGGGSVISLLKRSQPSPKSLSGVDPSESTDAAIVVVRPDGHVAKASWINGSLGSELTAREVKEVIQKAVDNSVGFSG